MLGVGGLSFSRGMGLSVATVGFTQKAGSKKDSLNLPFTFVPLRGGGDKNTQHIKSMEM